MTFTCGLFKKKPKLELPPEKIRELAKSTKFSKHEIENWQIGFLSDHPTGKMNKSQFIYLYKQFYPQGDPSLWAEHLFDFFVRINISDCEKGSDNGSYNDTNPRGPVCPLSKKRHSSQIIEPTLNFYDFVLALSVNSRTKSLAQKLLSAFKIFDEDNDGLITKEELTSFVKAMYALFGDASKENISLHNDSNELNDVSDNYVITVVEKLFRKLDTDNDEKLTKEEFIKGTSETHHILWAIEKHNGMV